uniref:Putative secreted protein n=1 Tax=Ixodes ricinus TaxID=34613 RepID=A0A6B0UJV4_IXORI
MRKLPLAPLLFAMSFPSCINTWFALCVRSGGRVLWASTSRNFLSGGDGRAGTAGLSKRASSTGQEYSFCPSPPSAGSRLKLRWCFRGSSSGEMTVGDATLRQRFREPDEVP